MSSITTSEPRAHCVTYVDEFSVGHDAVNDVRIGYEQQIVACNSARIKNGRTGDLVIITARAKGAKVLMIGRLTERADNLRDTWAHHGGTHWQYCWKIETIVPPIAVTPLVDTEIRRLSTECGISHKIILNSRLCPHRATPVLRGLATTFGK